MKDELIASIEKAAALALKSDLDDIIERVVGTVMENLDNVPEDVESDDISEVVENYCRGHIDAS